MNLVQTNKIVLHSRVDFLDIFKIKKKTEIFYTSLTFQCPEIEYIFKLFHGILIKIFSTYFLFLKSFNCKFLNLKIFKRLQIFVKWFYQQNPRFFFYLIKVLLIIFFTLCFFLSSSNEFINIWSHYLIITVCR